MFPTDPLVRARIGNTATFALAGVVSAVGSVRIPALSDQLNLDPGDVGLAMLAVGVGATAASQAGRVIMDRVGSRKVLRIACPMTAVLAAAPGLAGSLPLLIMAFLAFGTAFGFLDTSMNAQAATLERRTGRHLMNGAHAGWSVGAVSGGGIGALTAYLDWSYTRSVVTTAVVATPIALLLLLTYLPDQPTSSTRTRFGKVPAAVYAVGLVTFASFLIEGSVANWSGLYLRDELHSTSAVAAFGYPMLELGMIVGRTVGDRIRLAVGSRIMLTSAGGLAVAGIGLVVIPEYWPVALAGFLVVGLAVSTVVPLTFSIAGALAPSGAGVAQAAAIGYAGMLIGPVLLGGVADLSSLRVAFVVVAGIAGVMSVIGRLVPTGSA